MYLVSLILMSNTTIKYIEKVQYLNGFLQTVISIQAIALVFSKEYRTFQAKYAEHDSFNRDLLKIVRYNLGFRILHILFLLILFILILNINPSFLT